MDKIEAEEKHINKLGVIEKAILEKKLIKFGYQGSKDNAPSDRLVHGWVVASRGAIEYLIGWQETGGSGYAIRQYKISEIIDPSISDQEMTHFPEKAANPEKWDNILIEAEVVEPNDKESVEGS